MANKALCFRVAGVQIGNIRMFIKDLHNQRIHIIITYQLRKNHHLCLTIANQRQWKISGISLDFRGKPMNVCIRCHRFFVNEHRTGLVKGVVDGEGTMAEQKPTILSGNKGSQRDAAGAIASSYLLYHRVSEIIFFGFSNPGGVGGRKGNNLKVIHC